MNDNANETPAVGQPDVPIVSTPDDKPISAPQIPQNGGPPKAYFKKLMRQ